MTSPDPPFPDVGASSLEVLGVGASVDADTLAKALRTRLRAWHPDRFSLGDAARREEAEWASALANDAYRRLADPFDRAETLLSSERGVRPDAFKDRVGPNFFAEMLEIQERCGEFEEGTAADAAAQAALERDLAVLDAQWSGLLAELHRQFGEFDSGDRESALDAMAEVAAVRGYLRRAREAVTRCLSPSGD
ncbi:MAG: DnaJ family molecular chaperone [Armatimonadota bacterium]